MAAAERDLRKMWPLTAQIADSILATVVEQSTAVVFDIHDNELVATSLAERIETFISSICRPTKILVKTSTTGNRDASHEVSPKLLALTIDSLSACVPTQAISIADGPAYARSYKDECLRLGWDGIISKYGLRVLDLNEGDVDRRVLGLPVSTDFLEADAVINLSKVKTHRRFGVSLGAKSLLGTLSARLLGYPKLVGHHRFVNRIIAELVKFSPPTLTILDGEAGIEGEGPLRGRKTESHFVVFGYGYLGPDVRATIEMGFDPVLVPLFNRPFEVPVSTRQTDWKSLRLTATDFVPARSCGWLYKSLTRQRNREGIFEKLRHMNEECWDQKTLLQ